MKRIIYQQLKEWTSADDRKPLVLYGARQVGKTYILKEFGRNEYENLVYVNCQNNPTIAKLFETDKDVKRIMLGLAAYSNQTITAGKTLLFLDEIQEIPQVIATLKYFCEDLPDIHIAVAGSLLGVMNMQNVSFPVGKVNVMHLYPMTFSEFLWAMGKDKMVELLEGDETKLVESLSNEYIELLRQYYFVGGMPEAVLKFSMTRDVVSVRHIQKNILAAYQTDIAKHTGSTVQRIRMVWESIPSQLSRENKKFIYGAVKKGARANDFELAIQWLVDAGLVYKVFRVTKPQIPLKYYRDANAFKLYLLDVGLLGAMADVPPDQILIGSRIFSEYKGSFSENFVLQQIKPLDDMPIGYFSKDNSTMEVDFVLQVNNEILPVEVKAENNVKSKSLRNFITEDFAECHLTGYRFSMLDFMKQDWMENIPLYAVDAFIKKKRNESCRN